MLSCCAAGTHLSWARSGLGPNFAGNLLHCTANYFGHTGGPGGHIPQRPAIRRTAIMEYPRFPASVRFDAGELDHLGPLLRIGGDERAEVGGRVCKHRVAEVSDTRFHPGIGEARIDLRVELADDLGGRIPGSADPPASLFPRSPEQSRLRAVCPAAPPSALQRLPPARAVWPPLYVRLR